MPFSKLKNSARKHTLGKSDEQNENVVNYRGVKGKNKKMLVCPADYKKDRKEDDVELEKGSDTEEER